MGLPPPGNPHPGLRVYEQNAHLGGECDGALGTAYCRSFRWLAGATLTPDAELREPAGQEAVVVLLLVGSPALT